MKSTQILSIAIIAALPFAARAENISGAMYTAPSTANTNHPAPTTQAGAPFGRIDIDTADQEHIATTAYVKGAYNSAIAAANNVANLADTKQAKLTNADDDEISSEVLSTSTDMDGDFIGMGHVISTQSDNDFDSVYSAISDDLGNLDEQLMTAGAVLQLVHGASKDVRDSVSDTITDITGDMIDAQRVTIYTTWNDDSASATTQVELSTAQ